MRTARHGITSTLLGAGALALAFVLTGCAQATEGGGAPTGGSDDAASPTQSPSPEPSARPSPGKQQASDMELVAGAVGRGLPAGVEGTMDSPAGVGWTPETGLLYVVTYGSSSCPTLAEAEATGQGEAIEIVLVPPPADAMCTMDYAPTTTVVAVPDGADTGAPLTVTLGDRGKVEVEPRASDGEPGGIAWVAHK